MSFRDFYWEMTVAVLFDEFPGDITKTTHYTFNVIVIWRLHSKVTIVFIMWRAISDRKIKSSYAFWAHREFTIQSPNSFHLRVLCDFVGILISGSLQSNAYDDFKLQYPNDGHIGFTKWLHCNVPWKEASKKSRSEF